MAIAIGVFSSTNQVAMAILHLRRIGIPEQDMSFMVLHDSGHEDGSKTVRVSGYLERDAHRGEIRTIEEGVYLALVREGAYTEDMIMWLSDLEPGSGVVLIRSQVGEAPWMAEALRRAGAQFALDSESQGELIQFAGEHDKSRAPV